MVRANTSTLLLFLLMLLAGSQLCHAQPGISIRVGISETGLSEGADINCLGYEVNTFIGRIPYFSQQWGFSYAHDLNRRFRLSAEILHSRQGLRYRTNRRYGTEGYNLNSHYITVPVTLNAGTQLSKGKGSAWYLGPYLSLLVTSSRTVYGPDYYNKDTPENINRACYGFTVGYAQDIGRSSNKWFADIRLAYGISNTFSIPEDGVLRYRSYDAFFARDIHMLIGIKYIL